MIAKKLKLGTLLVYIYYFPKGYITRWLRWGPANTFFAFIDRREMEKAVYKIEPVKKNPDRESYNVHFLTGKRYWYQTIFCVYSLLEHSSVNLHPVIYDDGDLEERYREEITRIFPDARIIACKETEDRLDEYLPIAKFPTLRKRRVTYKLLRKLTDIHAGNHGWKLFLDSDMLFFRDPAFLSEWLKSPQKPCYMADNVTSYGYSRVLMASLAQAEIPERLNTGIIGLKSEDIDWENIEFWCKTMVDREGTHFYQEQAMVAMLLAGRSCSVAPPEDYIIMPSREEVMNPKGVLHHYVYDSKPWYFRYGWKHIAKDTA